MARDSGLQSSPFGENFDVGDDSDLPAFDQPYGFDDIDAIRSDSGATVAQRREQLRRMLDDLRARRGMDQTGEFDELIQEVRGALSSLALSADDSVDMILSGEDAAMAPDEILERAEDEAALERDEEAGAR